MEDNPKVNIYIETDYTCMSQKSGSSMYLVEFIRKSGDPETRHGFVMHVQGKKLQAILQAAAAALEILKKPCVVTVYTTYRLVKTAVENEWVEAWRENGWKKTNGAPLLHAADWEKFGNAADKHLVFVDIVPTHPYKEWMKREIQQKDRSEK